MAGFKFSKNPKIPLQTLEKFFNIRMIYNKFILDYMRRYTK